jgi:D-glycero-beta-D-manno-heptose-7-phosphate kinase
MQTLADLVLAEFPKKRIVIVGDLVADQFLHGAIERVSREAPVFILRHEQTRTLPGGAANAAVNTASLGARASLVGVIGKDRNGEALIEQMGQVGVNCEFVVSSPRIQTTTKMRVLAGRPHAPRQQVIRIDYENSEAADSALTFQLIENLNRAATGADAIIISDYGYGAANAEVARAAAEIARKSHMPMLVDSRFRLRDFTGATSATPNQEEVEQILGKEFNEADCARLCAELGCESLLITRGSLGLMLIEQNNETLYLDAVGAKDPVDVTGAGDTVIAAYTLAVASGLGFADAARIANHAGGIVVMKQGTSSVTPAELAASLRTTSNAGFAAPASRL